MKTNKVSRNSWVGQVMRLHKDDTTKKMCIRDSRTSAQMRNAGYTCTITYPGYTRKVVARRAATWGARIQSNVKGVSDVGTLTLQSQFAQGVVKINPILSHSLSHFPQSPTNFSPVWPGMCTLWRCCFRLSLTNWLFIKVHVFLLLWMSVFGARCNRIN